ncbi:hypothetical protein CDCA_CDCA10G3032 [Cyanidium caldarium]|uniref:Uncharacterized protein n=1 Tax=Cyanidium caldarium TaxID=2771 RepID=A0AAV9IXK0_CYACA|nr:hypothetical protein CDCA_CDCA10G3032 [Cyanidium caldarium]|eukprot:ctg_94.g58
MGVHESNRGLCEALRDAYVKCCERAGVSTSGAAIATGDSGGSVAARRPNLFWDRRVDDDDDGDGDDIPPNGDALMERVCRDNGSVLLYHASCARFWTLMERRGCFRARDEDVPPSPPP